MELGDESHEKSFFNIISITSLHQDTQNSVELLGYPGTPRLGTTALSNFN